MILSNLLLNIYAYSHRFVLLPTLRLLFCFGGNGECRNTLPWLLKVLRISNCEYSTSYGVSLSPPLPSQSSGNVVRKNGRSGGQEEVLWNAAFSWHNMAAAHTKLEKRWLPTYTGKNLIMQWGRGCHPIGCWGRKIHWVFVLSCFVFRNVATGRLFELQWITIIAVCL